MNVTQPLRPIQRVFLSIACLFGSLACLFMAFYWVPRTGGLLHDMLGDRPVPAYTHFVLHSSWCIYTILAVIWPFFFIRYFRRRNPWAILLIGIFTVTLIVLGAVALFIPLLEILHVMSGRP